MKFKSTIRWITLAALFIVPFFALIVADSYFFPFITGKAFFFRILVEIAFAGWVMLACMDAKYRPKLNSLTIAVTLFAIVALVADLLGANPLRSIWSNFERMEGWLVILHLWMFFMASTFTFGSGEEGKTMWRRWFKVSLGVALIVAFRGLLQLAGVVEIHQSASRLDSFLGNAEYLAIYMLIHAGLAVYFLVTSMKKWTVDLESRELWVYWTSIVASIVFLFFLYSHTYPGGPNDIATFFSALGTFSHAHAGSLVLGIILFILTIVYPYFSLPLLFSVIIYYTQTRGTALGLIGAVILSALLYAIFAGRGLSREKEPAKYKKTLMYRWICGGAVIVVILVGLITWLNRNSSFVQNSPTLSRLTSISWEQFSQEGRGYVYPMALKGFTQRPVLGWGQESFNYVFNANYNPLMYGQEQWFDRAHSVFLDWLIAGGIVGLIAYLALYVLFLRAVWKSELSIATKSILTALLAGYAIHNLVVFDNIASYIPFFALLGFAASMSSESKKTLWGDRILSKDAVEYVAAPIVIVVLIGGIYFFNVTSIQANNALITALQTSQAGKPDATLFQNALDINSPTANQEIREQLLSSASSIIDGQYPQDIRVAFLNLTQKAIDDQIASTPNDARIYTLAGSFWTSLGQFYQALPILEKAHALSPGKQSIDFDLAQVYMNKGRKDDAVNLLKTAYESADNYPQARVAYAGGLIMAGREAEAHTIFGNDPSIFQSLTIGQIYLSLKQYSKALAIYEKNVTDNPSVLEARLQLAQAQYTAGMKDKAIETIRSAGKDFPEYADRAQTIIKQLQAVK